MIGKQTVYLAGPIAGLSEHQAKTWREIVAASLADHGIVGVSPLRCEPPAASGIYEGPYDYDPKFGTPCAIAAKNFFDVQNCDLSLFYLPSPKNLQSYGTLIEFGWATALQKPTIIVTGDPKIFGHPIIKAKAGWLLSNLEDAVDVIVGILGGYTHGGKNV